MERKELEDLPKEELIQLLLDTWEGGRLREEDAAGTEGALELETAEADKYARLLAQADKLIGYLHQLRIVASDEAAEHKRTAAAREAVDATQAEITAAVQEYNARKRRKAEEEARRAERAAKKAKEAE
jgi:dsDNA-binding SOS-regulon protein